MKNITLIILLFYFGVSNAQEYNYTVKNISENTKYSDFGVAFYGEETVVFASSRKDKSIRKRVWSNNEQPFLDLYKGHVDEAGEIADIENFSAIINTKWHESNAVFTKDLKTVYFSRDNYLNKKITKNDEGVVLIQLYKAQIDQNGEWTNIVPLPFNSNEYDTGHPALNESEDKLYFISNMPGSFGSTDIYVVDINKDGSYGEPINLGPEVNTPKREMFPFIDQYNSLYFSSDGYKGGKGDLDIYVTEIVGNRAIRKAQKIGTPINSAGDDFGLVFEKGKKTGYFSSNRSGGKGDDDIYYFKQLGELRFPCGQFVEGVVRENEAGALIPGALVVLSKINGEKVESIIADKYGSFSFKVDCELDYKVVASMDNYKEGEKAFSTSNENEAELNLTVNLTLHDFIKVRGQLLVNINPIYFDLDESDIRNDAAIELEKVVRVMQKYPTIIIKLGSHTDSRARDKYNLDLSNRRAKSSTEWIIEKGIDASRISGQGYGETQLVNKCANGVKCSELEHQLNRRTEFVIINPEVIK